ncbi:unnamed protein product [Adineta steineri]|uniref:Uncharacterized protein n=2 Tax=Adineta steineri TaxID=433720 RepID=A0A813RTU3_9BILA|nr:unnamed protein product [Adineta steineri]CAF3928229.1 unnamed protein product [Adineta steineri]
MAGSPIKTAAMAVGVALGSGGIIVLVGLLVVGMVILSLIPIYEPNHSHQGAGEIYRIQSLPIKVLFANLTPSTNFSGGSVLNMAELSAICTSILRAKNIKDFYGCVATNFTVYGLANDSTSTTRRRRQQIVGESSTYEIGDILLLFSNTCGNKRALGNWYSRLLNGQNSSCVARRAAACKSFITTPNNGAVTISNQWFPFPSFYSQIVTTNVTSCAALTINRIYNVPIGAYGTVYGSTQFNITRPSGAVPNDCQYYQIVSQADMQNLVSNQTASASSATTTQCSSVTG